MTKATIIKICLLLSFIDAYGQAGNVLNVAKYGKNINGFGNNNNNALALGLSGVVIGDVDGNGINDIAIYAYDQSTNDGNVYIVLLNKNLTVKDKIRISRNLNGFPDININATFGKVCSLGDLNKDGIPDIAISDSEVGVIYITFLNQDGTIKSINSFSGNDLGYANGISFGWAIDTLGDFSKDGGIDLAIGAIEDNDGGAKKGAVFIVNLSNSGTAESVKKISTTKGGFNGNIKRYFGIGVNCIGDLNKDGTSDLIVSSDAQNHPFYSNDEFWILFLNSNGNVKKYQKISSDSGNLLLPINTLRSGLAQPKYIGDINGDGYNDIVVSAFGDTINGKAIGNSYILFLDSLGKVKNAKRVFSDTSSIYSTLDDEDQFGALSGRTDIDGDYKYDLLMSASQNDFTGTNEGLFFLVSLDGTIHPIQPKSRLIAKDTTGITTKTFTFTNTSSGYPKQVKWSFTPNTVTYQNGTTETSLDSVQVKFTAAGTYAVKLWVQNPFGQDSLLKTNYITVSPVSGFEELRTNPFTVYPIPAGGELQLSFASALNGSVNLTIQNCIGEIINTENRVMGNQSSEKIDVSMLPQGVYFLTIRYSSRSYTLKFIK